MHSFHKHFFPNFTSANSLHLASLKHMHSPGVIPVKWNFVIGFKSSPLHMVFCQTSQILKSLSSEITPVTKLSIKNVQERIIMLIDYGSVSIIMFTTVEVIRFMRYTHYPKFLLSFYPSNHLQKNIVSQGDKKQKKNPKQRITLNKYLLYLYYFYLFFQVQLSLQSYCRLLCKLNILASEAVTR